MIELQRRLAQDYQRQRDMELSHRLAQTDIRDNDQTVLAHHTDVERFGNGLPPLHQTRNMALRDVPAADRARVMDHVDHLHSRSGQQVAANWSQSDAAGTGPYGDSRNRQQSDRGKLMSANHGPAAVDNFVQQLKSRNAK